MWTNGYNASIFFHPYLPDKQINDQINVYQKSFLNEKDFSTTLSEETKADRH